MAIGRIGVAGLLAVLAILVVTCGPTPGLSSPSRFPATAAPATIAPAATVSGTGPATPVPSLTSIGSVSLREFPVPRGSAPHDVAPAGDGGIWYTAQATGELGWLDPRTGQTRQAKLGAGSRPHGVILGPDGAPWITDSGLNAIVRVDPRTSEVKVYPLPSGHPNVNLNTAVFDKDGTLWWTGQNGWFGRLAVRSADQVAMAIFEAPRGRGPYGITATPDGDVYYASLAGDHIAKVAKQTGRSQVIEPPTKDNGSRRVWSDSKGIVWVSEWDAGQLGRYDPATEQWKEWKLPGSRPQPYAVFVDDRDMVWLSDFGASALVRFDPATEKFETFPHAAGGNVRQIHGRPGEVFAPLSALDRIVVVTTR